MLLYLPQCPHWTWSSRGSKQSLSCVKTSRLSLITLSTNPWVLIGGGRYVWVWEVVAGDAVVDEELEDVVVVVVVRVGGDKIVRTCDQNGV